MTVESFYREHKFNLCKGIDSALACLMLIQWLLVIGLALIFPSKSPHPLAMALILGGLFAAPPLYFAIFSPGRPIGRYCIVLAQMCFSSLLIQLMGGRVEASFHIFGSLACLATYREWRLLALAAIITIVDHFIRGAYFPETLYGYAGDIRWRWLEHAGWVLFEGLFLVYACIQANKEMWQTAKIKAELLNARAGAEKLYVKRSQFFSLISHEIRTPLIGIIGFADFLNESPTPEEQKEYVGIIKQCSDTLLKLINDLLDFNKMDIGQLEIDPHCFKVHELQNYLENIFLLTCEQKKLQFSVEVTAEVPEELYGDSHRIRQVLTNLIGNAIKFTDRGGVKVRLSRQLGGENIYRWEIEDTGIGMKKESLQNIFSPYTQEHSFTSRKYGGSGLGLAISKTLVELMGGQLYVESTLGKGTRFFFSLPLK